MFRQTRQCEVKFFQYSKKTRKEVNPYGEIVTSNQQFIKALQENKKEKSKGRNKKPVHKSDTDSDSSIPEYDEINHSYSEDDTEMLKTHKNIFCQCQKKMDTNISMRCGTH